VLRSVVAMSLGHGENALSDSGPLSSPIEPGYTRIRDGVLQQWTRLYEDQTLKDVEITLCDGERVMADSLMLKTSSPVFRAMLTHDMRERQTMSLQIDDCPARHFRFFLRLLYTGQMNPGDWLADAAERQGPHTGLQNSQATLDSPLHHSIFASQGFKGASKGKGKGWQSSHQVPPLEFLLAAAMLAKKYQVEWLLAVLVDVVKQRLTEQSFERILTAAIQIDLSPVRLCALEFARSNTTIRSRYNSGSYSSELMFEMQAVFPVRTAHAGTSIPI